MTAQSPSAYALSALVHGAVVVVVLLFTLEVHKSIEDAPKVIELVAGEGDNYAATEAPALGVPGGSKFKISDGEEAPQAPDTPPAPLIQAPAVQPVIPAPDDTPPAPVDAVQPLAPAPDPVIPVPAPSHSTASTSKAANSSVPDLKKQLLRREKRKEAVLEQRYKKLQEARERKLAAEKKMTLAEFQRQQAGQGSAHAHIDAEGILKGVVGGSTANTEGGAGGTALKREAADQWDLYKAFLIEQVRKNLDFTAPDEKAYQAGIRFYLAPDGSISRVSISQSSGDSVFDQAVIEALMRTHSIGPTPDGTGGMIPMIFNLKNEEDGGGQ